MITVIDAFSEEQIEFSELAAKAFAPDAAPERLRRDLAGIGLPLLAVPEDHGGGGLTEADVVLIIEEAGYAEG